MINVPYYETGDLVLGKFLPPTLGIVVAVKDSNQNVRVGSFSFSYVYYVLFPEKGIVGPCFNTEISKV